MTDRDRGASPEYWLTLATEDQAGATTILGLDGTEPRHSVGLAAQAAEKALKAAVAATGVEPPWTHDLVALAHRSRAILRITVSDHDLRRLSDAHEQARYPESLADRFDPGEAVELTQVAQVIVVELLSALRPQ
jgi:HEPN domain-containing protein